ncbi:Vicilin-like antimicrobial peptides 2-1 [Acorus calamus]|uniref:Vicilin-like antimicrobial peptides 2-1 n=1 Tax=Acorus calamus TaxID=4465 RepID=A0AAV9EQY8_ACOCL|nr:Vicilin-like antimicrobial peptides 2-1 [Acorus calamus]
MATKPQSVLNLSLLLLLIILSFSSALSYYEEEEEQNHHQERDNPYFYSRERFRYTTRTQHGNVKVLERFSKRSELLRGIDNYRLAVLEANPYAFVMPSHWDADSVVFVVTGRGTMTILHEEAREVRQGDIVAVPSGVIVHLTNTDNREKLYIATIIRPISTPGSYKESDQGLT